MRPFGGRLGTPYAKVRRNAGTSVLNNTATAIALDTIEDDRWSMWNGGSKLIIPAGAGGIYVCTASMRMTPSGTTGVRITEAVLNSTNIVAALSTFPGTSTTIVSTATGPTRLVPGDSVELFVFHTAGATETVGVAGQIDTYVSALWVAP